MKRVVIIAAVFISILFGKDFTIADPPMIYIYHFVSYDTTTILLHGGKDDESKSKVLRFPHFNKNDVTHGSLFSGQGDNILLGKPLNPKLISSMVTSAVAKNPHVHISGESIQNRMKTDNFLNIIKSYDYPKRTDFVFIGEINTLASQYEVDLKLIDVSTQKIIASEFFNLEFDLLSNLRSEINSIVFPLMEKIVTPFIGSVYIRVDSTSRNKIRWDDISIRPLKSFVGSRNLDTENSDYVPYFTMPMPYNFFDTHDDVLSQYDYDDYMLIKDYEDISTFLAGDYRIKAFLKNNDDPFITDFTVTAGNLNEIHMNFPYPKDSDNDGIIDELDACPLIPGRQNENILLNGCPPPDSIGNITLLNIRDGIGFEILRLFDSSDTLIAWGTKKNNQIEIESDYEYNINLEYNSVTIFDLPLGTYLRNSYANTEERFPAKKYVSLFSDSDSLFLKKEGQEIKTVISDQDLIAGREIIIYFDPFTPEIDHKYRLYVDESLFAVTSVLGELHIIGMPFNYEGKIKVTRKGFEDAIIEIQPSNKKSYHLADLTKPKNDLKSVSPFKLIQSFID